MKKSLIALAVMAAAGAASAQSSVQLYGIADVWFGQAKITANGQDLYKQTKVDNDGVSNSRWGLKGAEDLGGGLKADFQLEQGFALDTGKADSGFNRVATVGLSGNFGAVTLGKQYTPYYDMTGVAKNTLGAYGVSSQNTTWVGYNANPSNTIKFQSNTYSGFSGAASVSLGEDKNKITANNSASDVYALSAHYANGPLVVGYAYQQEKNLFSAYPGIAIAGAGLMGAKVADLAAGLGFTPAAAVGSKTTYNLLTGSYDFGVAKLVGSFNRAKLDELKANEYQIGVDVPLASNLILSGGYANSKLKANGDEVAKTRGYSAALAYVLSKRTTAYAALNNTKLTSGGDELKATVYAVGVKHAF
jgi:predicted porin